MKIIEEGNSWSIQQRCTGNGNCGGGCNSLLLVETQDIYMTTHNVYFKGCYTFCCPVCGIENDIDSELLPYNVKKKIWEINGKYKIKKICR